MARTARSRNSQTKSKQVSNRFNCKVIGCSKSYSKISNLNNHVQVDHEGLRWICPECSKPQVSKDAHVRHVLSIHGKDVSETATENKMFMKHRVRMAEEAKDALLDQFFFKFEMQKLLLRKYKSALITTKKLLNKIKKDTNWQGDGDIEEDSLGEEDELVIEYAEGINEMENEEYPEEEREDELEELKTGESDQKGSDIVNQNNSDGDNEMKDVSALVEIIYVEDKISDNNAEENKATECLVEEQEADVEFSNGEEQEEENSEEEREDELEELKTGESEQKGNDIVNQNNSDGDNEMKDVSALVETIYVENRGSEYSEDEELEEEYLEEECSEEEQEADVEFSEGEELEEESLEEEVEAESATEN